eukprot:216030-Pyramimonas_sp.AAC.1
MAMRDLELKAQEDLAERPFLTRESGHGAEQLPGGHRARRRPMGARPAARAQPVVQRFLPPHLEYVRAPADVAPSDHADAACSTTQGDKQIAGEERPIGLMSMTMRVWGKMTKNRLTEWCDRKA